MNYRESLSAPPGAPPVLPAWTYQAPHYSADYPSQRYYRTSEAFALNCAGSFETACADFIALGRLLAEQRLRKGRRSTREAA